ncbi:MAG: EAL domain-containing protein [Clostridium sp.]|nr:EAL domain-containing protein [Clostridium sp.]
MFFSKNLTYTNQIKKIIAFIVLIILGLVGNYLKVQIFFGVDFIFGGIFAITIVYLYGLKFGILGALLIYSYTYKLWNHPYAIAIYIIEILFIEIVKRRENKNIIIVDIIYWILVGMPLTGILYYKFLRMGLSETYLIMIKNSVNGIFNAFCANLIMLYTPIRKYYFKNIKESTVPVNELLFNLFLGAVLLSNLFISVISSNERLVKVLDNIKMEAQTQSNKSITSINSWIEQYKDALASLGSEALFSNIIYPEDLQEHTEITGEVFNGFNEVYVANSQGTSISFYPKINLKGKSTIGLNFSDRKYFKDLKSTLKPVISDVFIGGGANIKPITTIGVPIIKGDKFAGAAVAELNLDYLTKILSDSNTILKNTALIIVDSKNSANWKLIVGVPIAPYQYELEKGYIKSLSIIFISIILTLLIVTLICRLISSPIRHLAEVTTHLPSKIFNEQHIKWPKTIIKEINSLIDNFKSTSEILNDNFKEIQSANIELNYLANHDPLTRLPNRVKFNKELNSRLEMAKINRETLAVLFLDLDRFKLINDTFGHDVGDKLLKEISNRLGKILGKDDMACRIGGDEFTILLSNIEIIDEVTDVANKILSILQKPYVLYGQEFNVSASIGIAVYPEDGEEAELLLKKADTAMYRAKENGKNNYQFYSQEMDTASIERFRMESNLRRALEQNEFIVYYQPRVDAATEKIIAVEALIRWNNPELGMVSPAKFIPLAEETGLIVPIGEWVLRTACKQNKLWQEAGYEPIRVSVNLSALQFTQQDLVDRVKSILDETKLDPQWLELEITEGIIIKDIKFTMITLEKLKSMGVKVSLDDFGTGFSSLNYLKNFKIDTLKIDSSFVRDINDDLRNTAIVNTIIMLGRNLELNVTAEGVETVKQLNFLKNNGCNEIQGFLYSKPVPPDDLERLISSGRMVI